MNTDGVPQEISHLLVVGRILCVCVYALASSNNSANQKKIVGERERRGERER